MDAEQRLSYLLYLKSLVLADYAEKGHEPGTAYADLDEFLNDWYDLAYKVGCSDTTYDYDEARRF